MKTAEDLRRLLERIDHRSYPAYKDTRGAYQFGKYVLSIDHVQGDPFAAPSRLSVKVPGKAAAFPKELYDKKHKRIALQDYLTRNFWRQTEHYSYQAKGSGKSGVISISRCGQEVLERTACKVDERSGDVTVRFEVGFPANGRTINARELIKILYDYLPPCVDKALCYPSLDPEKARRVMELSVDQAYIRSHLDEMGLVAFIANGSVLPRESGVSQRPMKGGIPFVSPSSMEVTLDLPYRGRIKGMGIRKGVTLIVGGGYHGKSTLLKALETGVYPHIAGDGREYVVTEDTALKIRAEDGRSIKRTDISMFISDLPNGKDTVSFETEDASGSTSQAANVIESMEAGAKALLIDEDTSATNFMIRDELMQRVIHREMEPITPFIERIRELYEQYDISTVIVAGSSGAYFHIADTIVQMDKYVPKEITDPAKREAENFPALSGPEEPAAHPRFERRPRQSRGFGSQDRIKMKTMGQEAVQINRETVDLRYVEQIVDSEQVTALGYCLKYAQQHVFNGKLTMQEAVDRLEEKIEKEGLAGLCESRSSVAAMAAPRRQEIFACLNRYRGLMV